MSGNNPSHGTKVADPSTITRENPGPIASDSLAAESTLAGGGFSENRNSTPSGVSGSSSTFANTNTSGATRLHPASDAETRKAEEDWAQEKQHGVQSTSYPTALGGQQGGSKDSKAYKSGFGASGGAKPDEAPSYVNSQFVDVGGPKGKNLKEGGFTSNDRKNASFNSEIGSKNDPGRLAELKMQRENANAAITTGLPTQKGGLGENSYETLERNESA